MPTSPTPSLPVACGASREDIFYFAESLAKRLDLRPGDDLDPIVNRLRGVIEYLPLDHKGRKKASISVNSDGRFAIKLPPLVFPLHRRVFIAHELGHFFLHSRCGEIPLEAFHGVGSEDERAEYEAHDFACAFLVPAKDLIELHGTYGNDTVGIASHFLVPEPIVRQRIVDVCR